MKFLRFLFLLVACIGLASGLQAQTKAVTKTITGDALTENLTVPSGKTLTVASGGTLTLPAASISAAALPAATESAQGATKLASAADVTNLLNFDAWGDSTTAGAGQTPWTSFFSASTGYTVRNDGVGGETSTQIKTRFDSAAARWLYNTIIMVGRNDRSASITAATTKATIASMVTSLGHTRYIVVGPWNGDYSDEVVGQPGYTHFVQLNSDLSATYGTRFVDARAYLMSDQSFTDAGTSKTANDITDITNGIVPRQWRIDNIHLTSQANALLAALFATKLPIFESPNTTLTVAAGRRMLLAPPAIGSGTPSTGAFTTLSATGAATFVQAIINQSGNAQPLVLKTSSSAQAGGGIEWQNSSGTTRWRAGTHGAVSGSEQTHLDICYYNGTDYSRGLRLRSDGGFQFLENDRGLSFGSGTPEGNVDRGQGSLYIDTAGGTATLWVKKYNAAGNPYGWRTEGMGLGTGSPSTGGTVSFPNNFQSAVFYCTPASTISTLTVNLPGNSDQCQSAVFFTSQTIKTVTWANATTVLGGPTTLPANSAVTFRRVSAGSSVWVRESDSIQPLTATATLDFPSISAAAQSDLTITVTGATTGQSVIMGLPTAPTAGIVFNAFVSAADTVTVRATNITASPVDPASATYRATVIQP